MRRFTTIAVLIAGLAALVATSAVPGTQQRAAAATIDCAALSEPLHERVNPRSRSTLLTRWQNEAETAESKYGYSTDFGIRARVSGDAAAGLSAVRRVQNRRNHDFRYVTTRSALRDLQRRGYTDQGVVFHAATRAADCVIPVYRYLRQGISRYAFTAADRNRLVEAGYANRQLAFYAAPAQAARPPEPPASAGPLDRPFYLSTSTSAWAAYQEADDLTTKRLLYQIAATPTGRWFGGRSTDRERIDSTLDRAAGRTPVFVLYAIPNRDCGGYSAGGLSGPEAYKRWVDSVRAGIAGRPAVLVVEPDAIGMGCLEGQAKTDRISMLRYALSTLSRDRNSYVYLHAGSAGLPPADVARTLDRVGISAARGMALNVSGYDRTSSEKAYGDAVLAELADRGIRGKRYVIDTSRNGLGRPSAEEVGDAPAWCNPPGRALGKRPTTDTGHRNVDAWLWIKPPGESDGECHPGDPSHWFQSYALGLSRRALERGIITELPLPR